MSTFLIILEHRKVRVAFVSEIVRLRTVVLITSNMDITLDEIRTVGTQHDCYPPTALV